MQYGMELIPAHQVRQWVRLYVLNRPNIPQSIPIKRHTINPSPPPPQTHRMIYHITPNKTIKKTVLRARGEPAPAAPERIHPRRFRPHLLRCVRRWVGWWWWLVLAGKRSRHPSQPILTPPPPFTIHETKQNKHTHRRDRAPLRDARAPRTRPRHGGAGAVVQARPVVQGTWIAVAAAVDR